MEAFVDQSVRGDDIAYVEDQVYIAARQRARDVYYPISVPGPYDGNVFPLMSKEQKDSITVLIVRPTSAADAQRKLGGRWFETGQELVPTGHGIFGNRNLGLVTQTLDDLRVFRRSGTPIQSAQEQYSGDSPVAP
jgi:hypothetical protein